MTKNPAKFADDVLSIIASAKAHQRTGNQDGEESLSHVKTRLAEKGWVNLSNLDDALKQAGFTLRTAKCGSAVRVYVGL